MQGTCVCIRQLAGITSEKSHLPKPSAPNLFSIGLNMQGTWGCIHRGCRSPGWIMKDSKDRFIAAPDAAPHMGWSFLTPRQSFPCRLNVEHGLLRLLIYLGFSRSQSTKPQNSVWPFVLPSLNKVARCRLTQHRRLQKDQNLYDHQSQNIGSHTRKSLPNSTAR